MSIEAQAREVQRVKKFESGMIHEPITITPDKTIREVLELTRSKNISGVPVVVGSKAVGIVTHRDLRFETKLDAPVSSVMTPQERLITVRENAPKDEVLALLHKHRIEKVLVVDQSFNLEGMITVKDFQKATEFPRAAKDERGALRGRCRRHRRRHAEACRGAARSPRRCDCRRHGAWSFQQRAADGERDQAHGRISQSSPATSLPLKLPRRSSKRARTASRSASDPARSARLASSPVSACRRSLLSRNVAAALERLRVPLIADGGIPLLR